MSDLVAQRNIKRLENFENGLICDRPTIKKILITKRSHKCEGCQNTEWNSKPIPLELDHINGNASNNFEQNLRLLCPNCHAQTPTAKGKNKGFGRKSLGIALN